MTDVKLYGRTVELEPLEPGETIEDVVVVARVRGPRGPSELVTAADREDGEPARMTPELRYMMDLGLGYTDIAQRSGRSVTAVKREAARRV